MPPLRHGASHGASCEMAPAVRTGTVRSARSLGYVRVRASVRVRLWTRVRVRLWTRVRARLWTRTRMRLCTRTRERMRVLVNVHASARLHVWVPRTHSHHEHFYHGQLLIRLQ